MKIKLTKGFRGHVEGSLIDLSDGGAQEIINKSIGVEYTDELAEAEKKEMIIMKKEDIKKSVNIQSDMIKKSVDEKYPVGTFFQKMARGEMNDIKRAVTGMSEGTAADGGNLLSTAISEIQGIATTSSQLYPLTTKWILGDRQYKGDVIYDAGDPWINANAPTATNPAEGGDKTPTKLAFGKTTVSLVKDTFYVPATDELLDDVASLDQFITLYLNEKMGMNNDAKIISGVPATNGYAGITNALATSTNFVVEVAGTEALPTQTELQTMIASVAPQFQAGAKWAISNKVWAAIKGRDLAEANLNGQLVGGQFELLGKPVVVVPTMTEAVPVIYGDFSQIMVVEPRINWVNKISEDVRFLNDETVFRLVYRGGSAFRYLKRTLTDTSEVAAFAKLT